MQSNLRRAGKIILLLGILMLLTGLILSITVGTIAAPILLSSSILVNSAGITLMRWEKIK